jgi:hypothetical protein
MTGEIVASLSVLQEAEKIEALNMIRRSLHQASPFRDEPIDLVEWVRKNAVPFNARAVGNDAKGYSPVVRPRGGGAA